MLISTNACRVSENMQCDVAFLEKHPHGRLLTTLSLTTLIQAPEEVLIVTANYA